MQIIINTLHTQVKELTQPQGINNLLYSPDAFFSCFADLALVSPVEYFHESKGSLMQVSVCVDLILLLCFALCG